MKKQLLFLMAGTFSGLAFGQTVLINENFDSYVAGDLVAETIGLPWSTWSAAPGGAEDTPISAEQANSGTLSMKVTGAAAGGPTDMVLRLGDRTTGVYALTWSMFIPTGSGGYFNVQHNEVIGAGSWMLDGVTFASDGTIEYLLGTATTAGTYPHDVWFSVSLAFDLVNQTGVVAIDGAVQFTWATATNPPSQVGAINFFAYAGGAPDVPLYYVDDVLFVELPNTSIPEEVVTEIGVYPNPTRDIVTVELPNASNTAVVSLVDVTGRAVMQNRSLEQRGAYGRTQLNLAGLPDGLYFVRIQDGDNEVVRRVTKH